MWINWVRIEYLFPVCSNHAHGDHAFLEPSAERVVCVNVYEYYESTGPCANYENTEATALRREIAGLRALEVEMSRELEHMRARQVGYCVSSYNLSHSDRFAGNHALVSLGSHRILQDPRWAYLECRRLALWRILCVQGFKCTFSMTHSPARTIDNPP